MPGVDGLKGIQAHEQTKRLSRKFTAQAVRGIDRVGFSPPLQFTGIQPQAVDSRNRQFQHGAPVQDTGPGRFTVRGIGGGDEPHFRKSQGRKGLEREAQVTMMNGIEGAAEDADGRLHLFCSELQFR